MEKDGLNNRYDPEDEALFNRIEAFLLSELSKEESRAFRQEMAEQPELKALVDLHRLEHEGMQLIVNEVVREKLKRWSEEPPSEYEDPPGPKNNLWKGFGMIGALLVLAFLIFLIVSPNDQQEPGIQGENPPGAVTPDDPATKIPDADPPAAPAGTPSAEPVERPSNTTQEPAPAEPAGSPSTPPAEQEQEPVALEPEQQTDTLRQSRYAALVRDTNFYPGLSSEVRRITLMSGEREDELDEEEQALRDAIDRFDEQNYAAVIELLEEYERENARRVLAHAYFRTGQFDKAASIFKKQSEKSAAFPAQRARFDWLYVLSLVGAGYEQHRDEIDVYLDRLSQSLNPRIKSEARKLKAELEQGR